MAVSEVASARLRSPEVARQLGLDGADVYRLLFAGELKGGPDPDGVVYFEAASVNAYLANHGVGHAPESSTGSSTASLKTSNGEPTRASTTDSRKGSSETQTATGENAPPPASDHS